MKTVVYNVAYKTEPGRPQYLQPFKNEQAAISFAYEIEANGGVAVLVREEVEVHTAPAFVPTLWPIRRD